MAKANLEKENYVTDIFITGNTVIDALLWGLKKVRLDNDIISQFSFLDESKKMILVTAHRRESFGKPFEDICNALFEIDYKNP